jgi:hypothetical protein
MLMYDGERALVGTEVTPNFLSHYSELLGLFMAFGYCIWLFLYTAMHCNDPSFHVFLKSNLNAFGSLHSYLRRFPVVALARPLKGVELHVLVHPELRPSTETS